MSFLKFEAFLYCSLIVMKFELFFNLYFKPIKKSQQAPLGVKMVL